MIALTCGIFERRHDIARFQEGEIYTGTARASPERSREWGRDGGMLIPTRAYSTLLLRPVERNGMGPGLSE